jgi:hypothetical protein
MAHPQFADREQMDFTFSEPYIVIHIYEKDQQNAHIFLIDYFN